MTTTDTTGTAPPPKAHTTATGHHTRTSEQCGRCGHHITARDRAHRLYTPGECPACVAEDIHTEATFKRRDDK